MKKSFAILIMTFFIFSLFSIILVNAESPESVRRQMSHLKEFCYDKNYNCVGDNPYDPNAYCTEDNPPPNCDDAEGQNYGMREYCCEQGWTNYKNVYIGGKPIMSLTWTIIFASLICLILIGLIIYLKLRKKNN